jgi:hypothetical protein
VVLKHLCWVGFDLMHEIHYSGMLILRINWLTLMIKLDYSGLNILGFSHLLKLLVDLLVHQTVELVLVLGEVSVQDNDSDVQDLGKVKAHLDDDTATHHKATVPREKQLLQLVFLLKQSIRDYHSWNSYKELVPKPL